MTRVFRATTVGSLCIAALALAFPLSPVAVPDDAVVVAKSSPLDGAWQQVEQKNGDAQEYQKLPEGLTMTAYVTGGRFV